MNREQRRTKQIELSALRSKIKSIQSKISDLQLELAGPIEDEKDSVVTEDHVKLLQKARVVRNIDGSIGLSLSRPFSTEGPWFGIPEIIWGRNPKNEDEETRCMDLWSEMPSVIQTVLRNAKTNSDIRIYNTAKIDNDLLVTFTSPSLLDLNNGLPYHYIWRNTFTNKYYYGSYGKFKEEVDKSHPVIKELKSILPLKASFNFYKEFCV